MTSFVRIEERFFETIFLCDVIIHIYACVIFSQYFSFQTKPCFGIEDDTRAIIVKFKPSSRPRTEISDGAGVRKSDTRVGKEHGAQ